MAEDAAMANLAGYIRRGRNLAPELDINHLLQTGDKQIYCVAFPAI